MSAEQAVANLVYAYAERLDAGDFAGVAELFSQATFRAVRGEATVVQQGSPSVLATFQNLVRLYPDGTPRTKHVTTNLIIEVDDAAGTATCRSYFSVLQETGGFGPEVVISGRYHDRFDLVDGRWRFTDRLIYSDLFGDLSRHMTGNPFGG